MVATTVAHNSGKSKRRRSNLGRRSNSKWLTQHSVTPWQDDQLHRTLARRQHTAATLAYQNTQPGETIGWVLGFVQPIGGVPKPPWAQAYQMPPAGGFPSMLAALG